MDPALKTPQEMLDFFNQKNISLGSYSPEQAIQFLNENTYFFKLISYRKNFKKIDEKYQSLTFDTLVDISNIDMELRYILSNLCLDIEHSLKTMLINQLLFKDGDDGYTFLERFIVSNPNPTQIKNKLLNLVKRTNKKLFKKHKNRLPIWVVIECCDFGVLESLIRFYIKINPTGPFSFLKISKKSKQTLLYFVRTLRNKSVHNSVILNSITPESGTLLEHPEKISREVKKAIKNAIPHKNFRNRMIRISTINDLTSLLTIYPMIVKSKKVKSYRKMEIQKLIKRLDKNKILYKQCPKLRAVGIYFQYLAIYTYKHL